MKIKPTAILFDMDGVIVDSKNAWLSSLNKTLKLFHFNRISQKLFNEKYWGNDVHNTLIDLGLPDEALNLINKFYLNHIDEVNIFPDVKKTLNQLNNYKKAIITNTPKNHAYYLLKKFDIFNIFNIIVTSDDIKVGKPNPEIIIKACELLNVKKNEVIIIGDTISDINAARAIGSTVIGINIKADYYIKNLSDIFKIINE